MLSKYNGEYYQYLYDTETELCLFHINAQCTYADAVVTIYYNPKKYDSILPLAMNKIWHIFQGKLMPPRDETFVMPAYIKKCIEKVFKMRAFE